MTERTFRVDEEGEARAFARQLFINTFGSDKKGGSVSWEEHSGHFGPKMGDRCWCGIGTLNDPISVSTASVHPDNPNATDIYGAATGAATCERCGKPNIRLKVSSC